jgi:hypothetical protein
MTSDERDVVVIHKPRAGELIDTPANPALSIIVNGSVYSTDSLASPRVQATLRVDTAQGIQNYTTKLSLVDQLRNWTIKLPRTDPGYARLRVSTLGAPGGYAEVDFVIG